MKSILIICNANHHTQRWCHYVLTAMPEGIHADMYCASTKLVSFDGVGRIYRLSKPNLLKRWLMLLPKIRGWIRLREHVKTISQLVNSSSYDAIQIHQPAPWQTPIVELAKEHGIKVILTPWGSDVLRCPKKNRSALTRMFDYADYVTCSVKGFSDKLSAMYNVNHAKIIKVGFGSEVYDFIAELKGKSSKEEIAISLDIPKASYYIACGYNAARAQRHAEMVEAIGQNIDLLPQDTMLLFQFTYGNHKMTKYIQEINQICNKYHLRHHFVTNYLSNELMAKYRLLADLFIHIQPTDAGNASLQEYLLAGTQCINGGWLEYPVLEQYGKPYYVCDSLDKLSTLLKSIFSGEATPRKVNAAIEKIILEGSWSKQQENWKSYYTYTMGE